MRLLRELAMTFLEEKRYSEKQEIASKKNPKQKARDFNIYLATLLLTFLMLLKDYHPSIILQDFLELP